MKLSEFYESICSGRTDEEYFLSKSEYNAAKLKYVNSNIVQLSGNCYFNCGDNLITSINLNIDNSMNNSMCLFKTGATEPSLNINIPSGFYINELITFNENSIYLISLENNVIMWTELVDAETE